MENLLQTKRKILIGMVHLLPTLAYDGWPGLDRFIAKAKKDLYTLQEAGFDAALIENDGDHPCKVEGTPNVVVPMTIAAYELKKVAGIPLGVEVLLNDPKASLTIAKIAGLDFIRTDYFVDRMKREGYGEFKINPKGIINFRKSIAAEKVKIFADVQVKYATMIKERPLSLSVRQAIKQGADGIIVSGAITGVEPPLDDVRKAKKAGQGRVPVLIGSGFSTQNAEKLLKYADWAIVGNSIKEKGMVDIKKAKELVELVRSTR